MRQKAPRYVWLAGVMVGVAAFQSAHAQSKQDICAAYAQRAVQQYQLMKSHPGCDAHLDRNDNGRTAEVLLGVWWYSRREPAGSVDCSGLR
jgi:hypothetical protein